MVCFPPAKINLGLRILGRRQDGFHEISSFFLPIALRDALEVIPGGSSVSLHLSGEMIEGNNEDNLVVRAWRLMMAAYGIPGAEIYLHKAIPQGAGLGGGSSDAAKSLEMARDMFVSEVGDDRLRELALSLGSDCPFFIRPEPTLVSGRGEILEPASGPDFSCTIVLLKPQLSIPTALAYRSLTSFSKDPFTVNDLKNDPDSWKIIFQNDFEPWARDMYPEIGQLIGLLYDEGAFYASLSGSGSSVFGLFFSKPQRMKLPEGVFRWEGSLG